MKCKYLLDSVIIRNFANRGISALLNDITEYRQMKRFLLSLMMAACLVGNIAAQEQQAFAAGMADILERSATPMTAYDMGQCAAAFFFPEVMRMKPLTGLVLDYDAVIDGARGALGLTGRKMTEEEAGMCLTKYYETLYDFQATQSPQLDNGDDIDDPALEEALKEAFKKAEEETATRHSDEEN